jgi:hypothetical protein
MRKPSLVTSAYILDRELAGAGRADGVRGV